MEWLCAPAAGLLVVIHALYTVAVVGFLPAVWWGASRQRRWATQRLPRLLHLLAILMVVAEDVLRVPCPLTSAERALRSCAGTASGDGDFLPNMAASLLYFQAPPWVFWGLHVGFAAAVLLTWWRLPPRPTAANHRRIEAQGARVWVGRRRR